MGKCNYTLTFRGQEIEFKTERELDKFITENIQEIASGLSSNVQYSLKGSTSQQQATIDRLQSMDDKVQQTRAGLRVDGKLLVGATRFIDGYRSEAGARLSPEFIIEFWEENYKKQEINSFIDSLRNGTNPIIKSSDEAADNRLIVNNNDLIKKYQNEYDLMIKDVDNQIIIEKQLWNIKASTGTVWHYMAEQYFKALNEKKIPTADDLRDSINRFKAEALSNPDIQPIIVDTAVADQFLQYLNNLTSNIKARFGDDVVFMTELKVYNLGKVNIKQLKKGTRDTYEDKGFDGIGGIVDLAVITPKGEVAMFDYKTTGKDFNDWNDAKKLTTNAQQVLYSSIIEADGSRVIESSLLPIVHEDYKETIDSAGNKFVTVSSFHTPKDFTVPTLFSSLSAIAQEAIKKTVTTVSGRLNVSTNSQNTVDILRSLFDYESASAVKVSTVEDVADRMIAANPSKGTYKYYDKISGEWVTINVDISKDIKQQLVKELTPYVSAEIEVMKSLPKFIKTYFSKFQESYRSGDPLTLQFSSDMWTNTEVNKMLNQYIIDDSWQIVDNAESEALGMVLFVNKSTGVLNILNLTTNDIRKPIKLKNGDTLLGGYLSNARAKKMGLESATYADIESFKVYNFIMNNEAAFAPYKIGGIETWQIKQSHRVTNRSTQFIEKIKGDYDKIIKSGFIEDHLAVRWDANIADFGEVAANLLESILETPENRDALGIQGKRVKQTLDIMQSYDSMDIEQKRQTLLDLHDQVLKAYGQIDNVQNDKMRRVLNMLAIGIATLNKIELAVQGDYDNFGNVVSNKTLAATNSNYINHPMIQAVREMVTRGLSSTAYRYQDTIKGKHKIFKDFYDSGDAAAGLTRIKITGNPVPAFREIMEFKDGKFTGYLKNPNSPELKPGQRKFINDYAEAIKAIRIEGLMSGKYKKTRKEAEQIAQSFYLAIPLSKASVMSAFKSKGLQKSMEAYKDYILNPNRYYDSSQAAAAVSRTQSFVSNSFEFAEPWNPDSRQKVLDNQTEAPLEDDLELMYHMFAMSTAKSVEMSKVTPLINAVKTLVATSADFQYEDLKNNYKYILDYVDYVIYGKRNIEKTMEKVEPVIYMLKDVNSMLTLGFNPFQTITEGMPGLIGNIVRSLGNLIDPRYFKPKDLINAYTLVAGDNVNMQTVKLVDEVNRLFRLADRSLFELTEKQQTGRRGAANAKGYLGYIFASIPGYWNRLSISLAQMAHDGVLIIENGKVSDKSPMQIINGELVYDAKKDKRFAAYLKDTKQDPNTASNEWLEARAQYTARVDEMRRSNIYKIFNDEGLLRYPYTTKETESIRNYCDRVHGHTSAETKAQLERFGIGSLFMQFKAWALAKVRRYWTKQGVYESEGFFETEKDENGKPLTASFEALYMEGILQTIWHITKETYKYKSIIRAGKELSVEQKSNLILFMSDMIILAFISLLVSLWAKSEMSPLESRVNRAVGQGVSDLNIINTVTMFVTPQSALPAIDKLFKLSVDVGKSLTGDTGAMTNILRTPAVVRSFQDIANISTK